MTVAKLQRLLFLLFALALVWGVFIPVFDVDAALYAALSMELLQQDNWLQLYERGIDYLDKPPLLFWLSALSFKVLGIETWAYKLPSILSGLLGIWYTRKLAGCFYDRETAWFAAAFYACSIGFFWIASDVKTDLLMSSMLVAAVYHLLKFTQTYQWKDILLYSLFSALAMMTKGMMGLLFPIGLIVPHLLMHKQLSALFKPHFLVFLLVTAILLLPMCIGLYEQFDQHPEKWVHEKQGVSGLRFYFWEQSFGRITGENKWSNHAPFHFLFTHAAILSFPAILLLPLRWYELIVNRKWLSSPEYIGSYGVLLVLVLLSLSQYKIPHYAAVVLPFLSLYLAGSAQILREKQWQVIAIISVVLVILVYLGSFYAFRERSWLVPGWGLLPVLAWNMRKLHKAYTVVLSGVILGILFNGHLLPSLHRFTETPQVLALMEENHIQAEGLLFYNKHPRSLEFALKQRIPMVPRNQVHQYRNYWFYMDEMGLNDLKSDGHKPAQILKLTHHNPERIELNFLLPQKRLQTLQKRYLVRIE